MIIVADLRAAELGIVAEPLWSSPPKPSARRVSSSLGRAVRADYPPWQVQGIGKVA